MALSFLKRQMTGLAVSALIAAPVLAQDFSPRLYVNDRVITQFEVDQRIEFLRVLRSPGDLEEEALKGLVEDRLRQTAAEQFEQTATEEEVKAGMDEFARRANLTADQLIVELEKVGIAAETFRDFVTAGILWRKVIRARYAGTISVSENEIDLALEATSRPGALRVLVSELVLPVPEGEDGAAQLEEATRLSETLSGEAAFAAAAQEVSAAPTRADGGRLDWMPLSNLPGPIGSAVLALGPGEVSDPLVVPGAVVLFLLRDVDLDPAAEPVRVTVEWAEALVPKDPAEIARLRAAVDVCYDLNGKAADLPADRVKITTQPAREVPSDVAMELARLDPGESSVALERSGFTRFLMLCKRDIEREEPLSRDAVRERLIGQKAESLAETFLEELRASAIIREP
jgi:peptidyl-prolyl cis-trans isomerase SurA